MPEPFSPASLFPAEASTRSSAKSKPDAFRFTLRRETRAQHEALDSNRPFAEMMAGTLSLDGYRRLMALFRGYYAAYDPALEQAVKSFDLDADGFSYQLRTPVLSADMSDLGDGSPEPVKPAAPVFISAAEVAGALYVLEGSLLGGSMLHAATEKVLAPHAARGNAYWQWCKDAAGPRWAMTCRLLESLAAEPANRKVMIASAAATFDGFAAWLSRWDDGDPAIPKT